VTVNDVDIAATISDDLFEESVQFTMADTFAGAFCEEYDQ
jgi:hypothetical protein